MGKVKLKLFDVSQKTNKFLSWSLGGYLVLEALTEVGDFIGLSHSAGSGLTNFLSEITQSTGGHAILALATSGLLIVIWEWFRRSLKAVSSKLWYVVLALIALIGCNALLSLAPDSYSTIEQIQHPTRFSSFASSFITVSASLQTILKIALSIGLIIYYRGRIRAFAWLTLICVLLIGDGRYLYTYLYNSGTNFMNQGFAFGFTVFKYISVILPVIFLRRTMTYTHVKSADGDADIK